MTETMIETSASSASDAEASRRRVVEELTPGERSALPVAGVRERRLPARAMLPRPRPSLRQAPRRPAAEARARFLPLVSCRAVCRRRFRRLPRRDGGQRGDERLLRLAQSVRGALAMMHRNMAKRTHNTPCLPRKKSDEHRSASGRSRDAPAVHAEERRQSPQRSPCPRARKHPRKSGGLSMEPIAALHVLSATVGQCSARTERICRCRCRDNLKESNMNRLLIGTAVAVLLGLSPALAADDTMAPADSVWRDAGHFEVSEPADVRQRRHFWRRG